MKIALRSLSRLAMIVAAAGVGLTAVAHPIDGVALLAQALARGFADHRIVFYEEEAHVQ